MTVQDPRPELGAGCETRADAAEEDVFIFPASFAQRQLWLVDKYEPDSALYNIPLALRLRGKLNKSALKQSLCELVVRHEVLRTTFDLIDGQLVQLVRPVLNQVLTEYDLVRSDREEREARLGKLLELEARKPFDLKRGPLFRSELFLLTEEEHVLLLTMHHIVSDGWSIRVLFQELSALYESFRKSETPSLPELPIQYADFAIWQQDQLQGEILQSQFSYWKERLKGDLPVLQLSTDRPRPAIRTHRGAGESFVLPEALLEALKALGQQEGSTLFMVLLAAFNALLYRHSGQKDIIVGTPIAGRNRTEVEGLIGYFVNTLALRTDLGGEPTFRELLRRTRETCLGAYTHQDLPFERLVQELNPERNRSHASIFQVMFALQNAAGAELRLAGLEISNLPIEMEVAKFDLTLSMEEFAKELRGVIGYSTDLFNAATIEQVIGHFRVLLEGIVAAPDQQIWKLPLLTESEQKQILIEWNHTVKDYSKDVCLHQLFERQVERSPDAVAVTYGNKGLTYRELNNRANQLAHHLRKHEVGPDVLVGICMERSLMMLIGILGILKAGGAYVPLDPDYPQERIRFLIGDADTPMLITQLSLVDTLPKSRRHIFCLDRDWTALERESVLNPVVNITAKNLAYIIYTSGSTGQPKGVAIEHHSPVALVHWAREFYNTEELDGVLASTAIGFDLSIFEIFFTLSCGAKVILAENALQLPALPDARHVTLINTVPSVMKELLRSNGVPSSVRVVNLAGEPLSTSLVRQIYQLPGIEKVYDLYGPSETTTYSTCALRLPESPASIGKPIANTQIYLLDPYRQPVPMGVAGELYIAGDGLARGYLNLPELTAEKFLPNPFSDHPGARCYRTGDLARYLPDGNIEFLGRMDGQVKIRGYRVELGEIEAKLCEHPAVSSSVVACLNDRPDDLRLVAYVVPKPRQSLTGKQLHEYLMGKLPHYMVPSDVVLLEALPRTPHGKVDLQSLAALAGSPPPMTETYVAPRTGVEEALARIWAEVLKRDRVGISDNFFDLGGHSLLAVRLFARIETEFGKRLPLASLFERGTVEQLAKFLDEGLSQELTGSMVVLKSGSSGKPFFFVHGMSGEVLSYLPLIRLLKTNRPIYGLQLPKKDGVALTSGNFQDLARFHVEAISHIQPEGPYYFAGYSYGGSLALEIAQQLIALGHKVALLAMIEAGPGSQAKRTPYGLCRTFLLFLRNLPNYMVDDLLAYSPTEMLLRIRRKARVVKRRVAGLLKTGHYRAYETRLDDFFESDDFPESIWKVQQASYQAAKKYVSLPYADRVTLFRARTAPFFHSYERDLGWSAIARGGVQINVIRGNHTSIMKEPHVRQLADQLSASLDEADRRYASPIENSDEFPIPRQR